MDMIARQRTMDDLHVRRPLQRPLRSFPLLPQICPNEFYGFAGTARHSLIYGGIRVPQSVGACDFPGELTESWLDYNTNLKANIFGKAALPTTSSAISTS